MDKPGLTAHSQPDKHDHLGVVWLTAEVIDLCSGSWTAWLSALSPRSGGKEAGEADDV